jgi:hypothetical protein
MDQQHQSFLEMDASLNFQETLPAVASSKQTHLLQRLPQVSLWACAAAAADAADAATRAGAAAPRLAPA